LVNYRKETERVAFPRPTSLSDPSRKINPLGQEFASAARRYFSSRAACCFRFIDSVRSDSFSFVPCSIFLFAPPDLPLPWFCLYDSSQPQGGDSLRVVNELVYQLIFFCREAENMGSKAPLFLALLLFLAAWGAAQAQIDASQAKDVGMSYCSTHLFPSPP
jgi:hypothetical protein